MHSILLISNNKNYLLCRDPRSLANLAISTLPLGGGFSLFSSVTELPWELGQVRLLGTELLVGRGLEFMGSPEA